MSCAEVISSLLYCCVFFSCKLKLITLGMLSCVLNVFSSITIYFVYVCTAAFSSSVLQSLTFLASVGLSACGVYGKLCGIYFPFLRSLSLVSVSTETCIVL